MSTNGQATEEDKIVGRKFSLLYPSNTGDIFKDYPHLRSDEAFNKLNNSEMMFVWYFACKSSPFIRMHDEQRRAKASVSTAFGKKGKPQGIAALMSLNFPAKIRDATERMSRYEPGPRLRAKMMVEQAFTNFGKLIDVNVDDETQFQNKDGEIDMAKKKSYTDLTISITKALPLLVQQAEGGFDITEVGDLVNETLSGNLLEDYLKEQKEI